MICTAISTTLVGIMFAFGAGVLTYPCIKLALRIKRGKKHGIAS
jgi:hypothetical protein